MHALSVWLCLKIEFEELHSNSVLIQFNALIYQYDTACLLCTHVLNHLWVFVGGCDGKPIVQSIGQNSQKSADDQSASPHSYVTRVEEILPKDMIAEIAAPLGDTSPMLWSQICMDIPEIDEAPVAQVPYQIPVWKKIKKI